MPISVGGFVDPLASWFYSTLLLKGFRSQFTTTASSARVERWRLLSSITAWQSSQATRTTHGAVAQQRKRRLAFKLKEFGTVGLLPYRHRFMAVQYRIATRLSPSQNSNTARNIPRNALAQRDDQLLASLGGHINLPLNSKPILNTPIGWHHQLPLTSGQSTEFHNSSFLVSRDTPSFYTFE